MTGTMSAQQIYDEAALWAAKSDAGPLHPDDQAKLDAWLSEDVRHLGAFAQASAHLTPLIEHEASSATHERPMVFRRRAVLGGGMAAASAGLLLAGQSALRYFEEQRYATRTGEMRVVPLNDGSVVSINTQSEIVVRYSESRRDIDLVQGEALFDVAKNAQRPFIVHAGDTAVRAVGTSFTVRVLPSQPVQILVKEGVVEVTRPDIPVAPSVRAPANTRATAPANAPIAAKPIEAAEVERALAWRDGRIAFHGEALGTAADEFARYSDIRIRIDDPSIAREKITGLFLAGDPIGFANAVAVSFDLRVAVGDNEVRLARR